MKTVNEQKLNTRADRADRRVNTMTSLASVAMTAYLWMQIVVVLAPAAA
ncbi:MAG: hypothetical protein AAF387_09035 [Pseudomonadota bacterium]